MKKELIGWDKNGEECRMSSNRYYDMEWYYGSWDGDFSKIHRFNYESPYVRKLIKKEIDQARKWAWRNKRLARLDKKVAAGKVDMPAIEKSLSRLGSPDSINETLYPAISRYFRLCEEKEILDEKDKLERKRKNKERNTRMEKAGKMVMQIIESDSSVANTMEKIKKILVETKITHTDFKNVIRNMSKRKMKDAAIQTVSNKYGLSFDEGLMIVKKRRGRSRQFRREFLIEFKETRKRMWQLASMKQCDKLFSEYNVDDELKSLLNIWTLMV